MSPWLIVRNKAEEDMKRETLKWADIEGETAWGHFCYILPGNRVYLAGIIPPSEMDVRRGYVHAQFGGVHSARADEWLEKYALQGNDAQFRSRGKTYGFGSVGHSHHRLGMFEYSGTDFVSMMKVVVDDGVEIAIGSLAVIRERMGNGSLLGHFRGGVSLDDVYIKYYCYSRAMKEAGVKPVCVHKDQIMYVDDLPGVVVPELGWHFLREKEYNEQVKELRAFGCDVTVEDMSPPAVMFRLKKSTWEKGVVIIETSCDFPSNPPRVKVLTRAGLFKRSELWQGGIDLVGIVLSIEREGLFHATV